MDANYENVLHYVMQREDVEQLLTEFKPGMILVLTVHGETEEAWIVSAALEPLIDVLTRHPAFKPEIDGFPWGRALPIVFTAPDRKVHFIEAKRTGDRN